MFLVNTNKFNKVADYLLKPVTVKQVKFLWQHVWRKQYSAAPQMVPRLNEYGEELDEDNEDDGIGMLGKEEMFQGVPNVPRRVNSESDLLMNNNGNGCNNVNNLMNNTINIKKSIRTVGALSVFMPIPPQSSF